MTEPPPVTFGEREWDSGLWRMVAASAVLHVVALVLLVLVPRSFVHRPQLVSYTVDLVAPDKIGGTNMIEGGKGRVQAAPLAVAPPAPKVEPPKPPAPKLEEAKPPAPPPQPEKPKEEEAVIAEKVKKAEAPPTVPVAPAAPSPKAVAKAEPPKAQPTVPSRAAQEAAKKAAAEEAAKKAAAEAAAKKAAADAAAAKARDDRIMAAIKRAEQQLGARGGGTGQKPGAQPGGPISVGPGEGAGGQQIGVEYLLYYNTMINRIKQSWAWAGSGALEAVVRFSITEEGDVVNVRITQPSGDPSYDASVVRAVKAVHPLPPPPEAFRKQFSDVEITFSPESLKM